MRREVQWNPSIERCANLLTAGGVTDLAINAGGDHTCANLDGQLGKRTFCWGRTADGRLGANDPLGIDNMAPLPRQVLEDEPPIPLANTFAVAAGNRHTCDIAAGAVYCWGANENGQVGNDGKPTPSIIAILIPTRNKQAQRVAVGDAHTCAITDDTMQCWGIDQDGEAGDGDDNGVDEPKPGFVVRLPERQIDLTAGHAHNCSLGVDHVLSCWGLSDHGELGLGDTLPRTAPTSLPTVAFCPPD